MVNEQAKTDSRKRDDEFGWPFIFLVVAGVISTAICGYVTYLSFGFEYVDYDVENLEERLRSRPILWVLSLFGVLFSIYLGCLGLISALAKSRPAFWVIIGFAVLFRGVLVCSVPIQEIDLYRYIWDGQVVKHGYNPYHFSPGQVRGNEPTDNPELVALREIAGNRDGGPPQDKKGLNRALHRVHFENLRTIYPPVSQIVFALSAWTTPQGASTHTHACVMKAWLVLFDLLTLWSMVGLLKTCRMSPVLVLAYAWCPLILKEFANGGHLDSITIFLSTTAVWLAAQAMRYRQDDQSDSRAFFLFFGSAIVMGLAIGAKIYPVVMLPLFAVLVFRVLPLKQAILLGLVVAGLASLTLFPLVYSKEQPLLMNMPVNAELEAEKSSGLSEFFNTFEMNDFLFMLIVEHIKPTEGLAPENQAWFLLNSEAERKAWIKPFAEWFELSEYQAAYKLARWISYSCVLMIVGYLCFCLKPDDPSSLARVCFLALAWFWLFSPTQNPWYWCWCLPLIPFVKNRTWFLMSGLVLIYYLRFWFEYHLAGDVIWPVEKRFPSDVVQPLNAYRGVNFFYFVVVFLEFAPWFLLLVIESIWNWRSDRKNG